MSITPDFAAPTPHSPPPPQMSSPPQSGHAEFGDMGAGVAAAARQEGGPGVWLCALDSFTRLHNHPLSDAERERLPARDFAGEVRVARVVLLRCSQSGAGAAVEGLHGALRAAWQEADALLPGGGPVSLHRWSIFARGLSEGVCAGPAALALMRDARRARRHVQPRLVSLAERLTPDSFGADMLSVFSALALPLARLRHVGEFLQRDRPLKPTLALFALLHEETRELLSLIEARTARVGAYSAAVSEALDAVAYAARMELRKCFSLELCGLAARREPPALYSAVETAHGLLRDCLQQSTVALAQALDPSIEGAQLFEAFQTKLEQSLALRRDAWLLLDAVARAEREPQQRALAPLLAQLESFRGGSMRFLMFKDWEAFERFADELAATRGGAETGNTLHRFRAYLETLFGQINMRAVLAAHPFDPSDPA